MHMALRVLRENTLQGGNEQAPQGRDASILPSLGRACRARVS